MPRKRKGPWQRSSDKGWYTTIGRTLHKLGDSDTPWDEVEQAYCELHAKGEKPTAISVAWVLDEFLDFCQQHRAPSTYAWYANYLSDFVAVVGDRLRVDNLTPRIVSNWIDRSYGNASASAQHAAARCVVRAMNWAVAERIIAQSPLAGYTKPAPSSREVAITPKQYAICLENAKGPFRDALRFLWETGCRPLELRTIEARWIDEQKIVFPVDKSKGKKRRRVIYMNETAVEIAQRLAKQNPTGPIFRNSIGNPWTKDALNCAFGRLRKRTGIEGLCAYALRHGFATESLKNGVDSTTVGVLMGHANPNMVARVYQHLSQDDDYLLGVVGQLGGGNGAAIDSPQAAEG